MLTARTAAVLRMAGEELSALARQEVAALGDEPLPRGAGGVFGRLPAISLRRDGSGAGRWPRPSTGRAPLSCRRAEEIFEGTTRLLATPLASPEDIEGPDGFTLHRLRHSALTHAVESGGTSTPLLLARSRHASVRSLERYARPGVDAVARHVAERDRETTASARVPLRQNRQPAAGRFTLSESDGSTCNMGFRSCRRWVREG
ncbi:site-specific integrase [Streptomyces olivaceoviridis]|uniref:hypothetical protein n=1 Tax=Streptomyces olivaceoviridis TaxID=1921 RepID=UPI0036F6C267